MSLRGILDRFRPSPLPGRAGPVGIPTDVRLTPADELAALFPALDTIEAECAAIREASARRAEQITHDAAQRTERIETDAVSQAQLERGTVAAALRAAAEQHHAQEIAAASRRAEEIRANGLAAITPQVSAAVARVSALADDDSAPLAGARPDPA